MLCEKKCILNVGDDMVLQKFERIRNLREDNDLKQRQLAELLGCDQRTYSDYERGLLNIPNDILIKLALYYNTSVDYLLGLTDNIVPYSRNKAADDRSKAVNDKIKTAKK